jgi:hypothetical membrane protein
VIRPRSKHKTNTMINRYLLYTGFLTPIIFWTTTIICGFVMGNYSHTTMLVSELGAIGTSTRYLFTAGLVLSSICSVLFIVRLYKTAKQNGLSITPILILLTFSFSICGAALFPMPLRLHGILGMPSVLLFLSPIFSLLLWKREIIPSIRYFSILALVVMLLGFSVYLPNILSESFGLKQRFFHFGWSIWFVYLGAVFVGLSKKTRDER